MPVTTQQHDHHRSLAVVVLLVLVVGQFRIAVVDGFVLRTSTTSSPLSSSSSSSSTASVAASPRRRQHIVRLQQSSSSAEAAPSKTKKKKKETQILGLLTFDLDDTLYPVAPVLEEADAAFVRAMEQYGFPDLKPSDIVETGRRIREEIGGTDPEKAAALTHTEIRELAIRRVMEEIILDRKLQSCADDWATQVDQLNAVVVNHARSWAKNAVSESVVQAVLSAWQMERHHAAERHLYAEVVPALREIRSKHSDCIVGAVTDGVANPLFMMFTLAPYFDFCCSWEDDQGSRKKFFTDLRATAGESAQLSWIYNEARHKYSVLKKAADGMKAPPADDDDGSAVLEYPDTYDDRCWIHVGDDLAFDVGGAAACGARTIYVELDDDKYGQTARHRFGDIDDSVKDKDKEKGSGDDDDSSSRSSSNDEDGSKQHQFKEQPSWSFTRSDEIQKRREMNNYAKDKVTVTLNYMSQLTDAIDDILAEN